MKKSILAAVFPEASPLISGTSITIFGFKPNVAPNTISEGSPYDHLDLFLDGFSTHSVVYLVAESSPVALASINQYNPNLN